MENPAREGLAVTAGAMVPPAEEEDAPGLVEAKAAGAADEHKPLETTIPLSHSMVQIYEPALESVFIKMEAEEEEEEKCSTTISSLPDQAQQNNIMESQAGGSISCSAANQDSSDSSATEQVGGVLQILDQLEEIAEQIMLKIPRQEEDCENVELNNTNSPNDKSHSCLVCYKTFRYASRLKCHMKMHNGENNFSCSICFKTFCFASRLKCHMKIHSREKHFSCSICEKSFSHNSKLVRHIRTHTGNKLACIYCYKSLNGTNI